MNTLRRWLARIVANLLDAFAVITGFYYSKKYAAIIKRLGLRPETDDAHQPGLIIIQIDGLAYDHLLQAVENGHMPYIRHILKRGDAAVSRWRCGLPSTTPAAQAGIMFGNNEGIPAFRWYDKQRSTSLVCKLPGTAASLQSQIAQKPGILTNGVSYVNIFDGGAASSLFTLSTLQPRHLFAGVQGISFIALFLLNPIRALRILYLVLREYLTDAIQRLSSRIRGLSYLPFIGVFPLLRVFSNVIFREIETFAVLVDIYRGVPAIYATYYGYDELAHHFGIHSIAAHQALRDIDGCIRQIDRLRRAGISRPYALFVLSDHGLTPAVPFEERYGQTLGQYIASLLGKEIILIEHGEGEQQYLTQTRYLLDELKAIEANLPPTAARVARRIRILVRRRLAMPNAELPTWNAERKHDVVVKSSGSLAHVYFNIAQQPLDLSEISTMFPNLLIKLLAHEGIWLVVAREREQVLIMSQQGILTYDAGGIPHVEGENPLQRLPEPWHAAQQIRRIASFPQSGDLILFGNYDPEKDLVICFERQWASHGGLGGAQDYPFILYPRYLNWDLSLVHNACDLYPLFAQQRNLLPSKTMPDTGIPLPVGVQIGTSNESSPRKRNQG
ncbi:MAG: alkaline phosphatase family protein [Anaerolineae bacterium]